MNVKEIVAHCEGLFEDRSVAVGEAEKPRHPEERPSESATKDLSGCTARQILRSRAGRCRSG